MSLRVYNSKFKHLYFYFRVTNSKLENKNFRFKLPAASREIKSFTSSQYLEVEKYNSLLWVTNSMAKLL